jgi:D-glycero-alpha-D-manno-heptose-7-phosphate kinase
MHPNGWIAFNSMLFTGFSRTASEIAEHQIAQIPKKKVNLHQMMQLVDEAESLLLAKEERLDYFGKLLHDQWLLKRDISSHISTPDIDDIYERAMKAGALGGKLLGAGNGGFMLVFVRPELQEK